MPERAVCGKELEASEMEAETKYLGDTYYMCSPNCRDSFRENTEQYTPQEDSHYD
jgi:YHS domain-containing protein